MNCKTFRLPASLIALFIAAFPWTAPAQNLIVNPSFETGAFVNRGDGYMILPNGSTAITGWTVVNDTLAWGTFPNSAINTQQIVPFHGSFFLDLQGDGVFSAPYGGVSQAIATVVGQVYHFTFALGTQENPNSPFTHGPVSVNATAGSTTMPFTFTASGTDTQWGTFGFDFTATSAFTTISIIGTNTAGGAYIGLDLVSVTRQTGATVPDHGATAALMLLALLPLAAMKRRPWQAA